MDQKLIKNSFTMNSIDVPKIFEIVALTTIHLKMFVGYTVMLS